MWGMGVVDGVGGQRAENGKVFGGMSEGRGFGIGKVMATCRVLSALFVHRLKKAEESVVFTDSCTVMDMTQGKMISR